MTILYLSYHPPLDPLRAATGNQVREAGIKQALHAAGVDVRAAVWRSAEMPLAADTALDSFASRAELSRLIRKHRPSALVVGYIDLLRLLPDTELPVLLDLIAPRLLEAQYQPDGTLAREGAALMRLLPRADHFLVGNQRQADLLLGLLLLCGFDCRARAPITVLPIAAWRQPGPFRAFRPPAHELRLVTGGVDWPWRRSEAYLAEVEAWCAANEGRARLLRLSGNYPGSGEPTGDSGLKGYQAMQELFADCHVGLELAARNTEREFSHSFRLVEYLQCGLPVIANAWLPIAPLIRDYDAGWLIEEPAELNALLDSLCDEPAALEAKAVGARRLVAEKLNYAQLCQPLLDWLEAPQRPKRGRALLHNEVGAIAPARRGAVKQALLEWGRWFFARRRRPGRDILMVTRSDLFPTDHGAAVKIVRTAEALSRQGGDVYLCSDDRRAYLCFRKGEMSRVPYPWWLRLLAMPRALGLLRLMARGLPYSNAFLYLPLVDNGMLLRTIFLAREHPIGAWLAEFPAYVRPCHIARQLMGGRVVLVEHNVEYLRLREQLPALNERAFEDLRAIELQMCNLADAVVTVSERDRDTLLDEGIAGSKVYTIPHGVDLAAYQGGELDDVRARYNIPDDHLLLVYHGTYAYPPNLEAMQVMARELLPRLEARGLAVSVLALGNHPPRESLHPRLHFTGSVAEPARLLPVADLAVVPLLEGGGTRMKVLDYFAAGVPVISTSKGVEGLNLCSGEHALIVDGYEEMAAAVARLAADSRARDALRTRARDYVGGLGWDAIAARYRPLLWGDSESVTASADDRPRHERAHG